MHRNRCAHSFHSRGEHTRRCPNGRRRQVTSIAPSMPSPVTETRDLTSDAGTIVLAGPVRRVAIITTGLHPCACYVARRLRDTGVEIAIFSEAPRTSRFGSIRYLQRLLKRRGWAVFLDNLLLEIVRRLRRAHASRGDADGERDLPACLRSDPDILRENWLRVESVARINGADRVRLEQFEPDLVVLAGAPILSSATIRVAKVGCLNPHCGITPRYAGNDPQTWAAFEGLFDEIGFTVHAVVPIVDGGPVLYQERVSWNANEPIDHTWPLLAQRMYDQLCDIVMRLIAGEPFAALPQSNVVPRPPAGFVVRLVAENRRRRYARRLRAGMQAAAPSRISSGTSSD